MKVFGPILILGILLLAGPIAAGVAGIELGGMVSAVLLGFGVILTLIAGIALVISNLYNRTSPDEAFVRSGMGGVHAIIDGGAIVVGVIHEKVTVSLRTIRLVVERRGTDALLTHDKLRADIKAEFFIRVQAEKEDVINAARSFGDRMRDPGQVAEVVEDKLISALRTVAATMSLEDLNSRRDDFLSKVKEIVVAELKPNGLTLESTTISYLDQTDARQLRPDNVFDAQGLRTIAEITQSNLTQKNEFDRKGEEARRARDVDNKKKMLALAQEQAEAEAKQEADIAAKRAGEARRAQEAEIDKTKAIKIATEKAGQAEQVAEQERIQAVEVATQAATKAREVAEQERLQGVSDAQAKAAKAEAARLQAEAEAETARQKVETVKVKEAAERDKQKRVIDAEARGQEEYVKASKEADAKAYELTATAEAKKKAAEADATAITKRADAEKAAAIAQAEGKRAGEMIPVDVRKAEVEVAAKQVDVDKRRIDEVLKPELEARAQHGQAAQDFELGKLRVQADIEIGRAAAEALGKALTGADMTLFGTPEDAARMVTNLATGMGLGQYAKGAMQTLPPELISAAAEGGKTGLALLGAIAQRLGLKIPEIPTAQVQTPTPKPADAPADGEANET